MKLGQPQAHIRNSVNSCGPKAWGHLQQKAHPERWWWIWNAELGTGGPSVHASPFLCRKLIVRSPSASLDSRICTQNEISGFLGRCPLLYAFQYLSFPSPLQGISISPFSMACPCGKGSLYEHSSNIFPTLKQPFPFGRELLLLFKKVFKGATIQAEIMDFTLGENKLILCRQLVEGERGKKYTGGSSLTQLPPSYVSLFSCPFSLLSLHFSVLLPLHPPLQSLLTNFIVQWRQKDKETYNCM